MLVDTDRHVLLNDNKFVGTIPSTYTSLTTLRFVWLMVVADSEHSVLNTVVILSLALLMLFLVNLTSSLDLSDNSLNGTIPATWSNFTNLVYVVTVVCVQVATRCTMR